MSRVEKDIMVALGVLTDIRPIPRSYGHVFVNTNEELSLYYNEFPIAGNKVLTVSSGGDQILQAVCNGASKIDAFDRNKFALYVSKLKIAAIKVLSCYEFQSFFYDEITFFDTDLYHKIRLYLDDETKLFWDALYEKLVSFRSVAKQLFFSEFQFDVTDFAYSIPDNYYLTRKRLESVDMNLYHASLNHFLQKNTSADYSCVFLSNIFNYLSLDAKREFNRFINKNLAERLSSEGAIAVYAPPYVINPEIVPYEGTIDSYQKVYAYKKDK